MRIGLPGDANRDGLLVGAMCDRLPGGAERIGLPGTPERGRPPGAMELSGLTNTVGELLRRRISSSR